MYTITHYLTTEYKNQSKVVISENPDMTFGCNEFFVNEKIIVKFASIPQTGMSEDTRKILEKQIRQYSNVWVILSKT